MTEATRYTFWLGKGTSGSQDSEVFSTVVTGTSFAVSATVLVDGGQYTWNVSAGNASGWGDWGEDQYFTVEVPSGLPAPALLTPLPYVTGVSRTVTFTWALVSGATRYAFWLGKGTSGSEDSEILNVVVTDTSYTVPAGTLEAGAVYTWNVSAGTATAWGLDHGPILQDGPLKSRQGGTMILDAIEKRYSVRHYKDQPVEEDKLAEVL